MKRTRFENAHEFVSTMRGPVIAQLWMVLLVGTITGVGKAQVSTAKVLRGNSRRNGEMSCFLFLFLLLFFVAFFFTPATVSVGSLLCWRLCPLYSFESKFQRIFFFFCLFHVTAMILT